MPGATIITEILDRVRIAATRRKGSSESRAHVNAPTVQAADFVRMRATDNNEYQPIQQLTQDAAKGVSEPPVYFECFDNGWKKFPDS